MNFIPEALQMNVLSDIYLGGLPSDLTYLPHLKLYNFTGCMGPVIFNDRLLSVSAAKNGVSILGLVHYIHNTIYYK